MRGVLSDGCGGLDCVRDRELLPAEVKAVRMSEVIPRLPTNRRAVLSESGPTEWLLCIMRWSQPRVNFGDHHAFKPRRVIIVFGRLIASPCDGQT